jgi:hypothetical protein
MIADIIANLKGKLAQAEVAGEPDDWNISVPKADLREIIEALKSNDDAGEGVDSSFREVLES